jgi:hypothetical protein
MGMNQGGRSMSSSEILYPDPKTIPAPPSPSYQQPIPLVTLSELIQDLLASTGVLTAISRRKEEGSGMKK